MQKQKTEKTNLRSTSDKFHCNNDLHFIKIKSTILIRYILNKHYLI